LALPKTGSDAADTSEEVSELVSDEGGAVFNGIGKPLITRSSRERIKAVGESCSVRIQSKKNHHWSQNIQKIS
jgi:hypothetical protein